MVLLDSNKILQTILQNLLDSNIITCKRLNGNYTQILRATLNRSWKDHPNNKDIYGNIFKVYIPDIYTSIKQQRLRLSGHFWRYKLELASDFMI